ncbi:MAG TPA: Asp-tRNA(Asn)/Glu-tRNA(Gln) amidotransferase subunit GatB [Chthonomonadales bacterium]|nr:Asp-tRNA(Asn)/Glu-tRNA(Gln) amidotransferase subunit GatB [Chthonomonadales bacterium]
MADYEAVIGMEVHAELLTDSKMFCGCRNAFGGEPNSRCCPVCLGMPGSLPVPNRTAIELVMRTALALNCIVNEHPRFDRKNYYYPDLPKGYQISQYDRPIGVNGWLDVELDGKSERVGIARVHLEEDTGKLFHVVGDESEVDYNRSGVPLMEIVTAFPPDMRTAEQARAYLVKLRSILTYIGVSDGKMAEGSLRCEPNLSVRVRGAEGFGVKTEIKNLNSFRAVYRGIEYELERQVGLLRQGAAVTQETRGWNDAKGRTYAQRSKEEAHDYRYFPEPDLVPLHLTKGWVEAVRTGMPELPDAARERLARTYALSRQDAAMLTQDRAMAVFFESAAGACGDPKAVANWMMGDLARLLNAADLEIGASPVTPASLAEMIGLVRDGTISGKMAKAIFERMFETGASPAALAAAAGPQVRDRTAIAALIDGVLAEHQDVWHALCEGDEKKFGFLIGQVMKASQGKANPQEANRSLRERLESARTL